MEKSCASSKSTVFANGFFDVWDRAASLALRPPHDLPMIPAHSAKSGGLNWDGSEGFCMHTTIKNKAFAQVSSPLPTSSSHSERETLSLMYDVR